MFYVYEIDNHLQKKKPKYQTTDFVDPYKSMGVTIEKRKIRSFFSIYDNVRPKNYHT